MSPRKQVAILKDGDLFIYICRSFFGAAGKKDVHMCKIAHFPLEYMA